MSNIKQFSTERKLTQQIEDAFNMYCRSTYAERFTLRNGDTVQFIVSRMTREQVEEAWNDFVREMRQLMPVG